MKTAKRFLAFTLAALICGTSVACKKSFHEQGSSSDTNYDITVSETETVYEKVISSDSAVQSTESKNEAASSVTAPKNKKKTTYSTATKSSTASSSKTDSNSSKTTSDTIEIASSNTSSNAEEAFLSNYALVANDLKGEVVDVAINSSHPTAVLFSDGTIWHSFVTGSKTYSSGLRYKVCKPEQKIVRFIFYRNYHTLLGINQNSECGIIDLESGRCYFSNNESSQLLKSFVSKPEQIIALDTNREYSFGSEHSAYYSDNKIYQLENGDSKLYYSFSKDEEIKFGCPYGNDSYFIQTNKGYYRIDNCLIEGEFIDSEKHYEVKASPLQIKLPEVDDDFHLVLLNSSIWCFFTWKNCLYKSYLGGI